MFLFFCPSLLDTSVHSIPFLVLCPSPFSPGNWVNSSEWQASPEAVDGWVDPLRWDQCPGGGGIGGYGKHCPLLTGCPPGPGCWLRSWSPYWLPVWRGHHYLLPRKRRPLRDPKVSNRGWEVQGRPICLVPLEITVYKSLKALWTSDLHPSEDTIEHRNYVCFFRLFT